MNLQIRKYRQLKRLTQEQLGEKVGISSNYLSEIEHAKYDIKLSLLLKISQELDVCVCKLTGCEICNCNSYSLEK